MFRIAIFGSECTGKTSLAKMLAVAFDSYWVPEYARGYALRKPDLTILDVPVIMNGQIRLEEKIAARALQRRKKILICDTVPLSSLVYSQYYYQDVPVNAETLAKRSYALYLLMDIDVPWQDDPARGQGINRPLMHAMFAAALTSRGLPYQLLSGTLAKRFAQARTIIWNLSGCGLETVS